MEAPGVFEPSCPRMLTSYDSCSAAEFARTGIAQLDVAIRILSKRRIRSWGLIGQLSLFPTFAPLFRPLSGFETERPPWKGSFDSTACRIIFVSPLTQLKSCLLSTDALVRYALRGIEGTWDVRGCLLLQCDFCTQRRTGAEFPSLRSSNLDHSALCSYPRASPQNVSSSTVP